MGWFSEKCPIHKIDLEIGKDYMCNMYYYCPECRRDNRDKKDLEARVRDLENKLLELEEKEEE